MKIVTRTVCLVFIFLLGLGLFGPAAGAKAARTHAVVASSPFWAVRRIVQDFVPHPGKSYACKPVQGNYALCPMTSSLKKRANQLARLGANPICRCQNTAQSIRIDYASRNGASATVATIWQYGPSSKEHITFVTVRTTGTSSWQVNDTYCTGHPNTSMYKPPKGPCH
jgi:hypothetical protein